MDVYAAASHPPAPAPHVGEPLIGLDGVETTGLGAIARRAVESGLRRVHLLAWRDIEDAEAGGSELHAHRIAALWAAAGLDVTVRTSSVDGAVDVVRRDGYRVIRKAGRYAVFPRTAMSGLVSRRGHPDGLVEIWNGMPFFSPLWARCTRVVFLHHVHAEMWGMTLPPRLARAGELVERRLAPLVYRRSRVVTLSESSRQEILAMLGFPAGRVEVVAPGIDPRFSPGPGRSAEPLVLGVGRLVPVKRFEFLVDALVALRRRVPTVRGVIVGEGYARPQLEAKLKAVGAEGWVELVGRRTDDELLRLYRRAWVLASASQREGWGMSITEAAACGTPSVVTRIAGHCDAVDEGVSGLLVGTPEEMAGALADVIGDRLLRERLRRGAVDHAARFTWEATAAGTLRALVAEHESRRGASRS
ncbi:MAG: glycosyltransferase family 4 protein [Acidimicrobiales bacterium]